MATRGKPSVLLASLTSRKRPHHTGDAQNRCLNITFEQSQFHVWQQLQSNGSLSPDEIEIRDASLVEEMNNLSIEDGFSDEDNENEALDMAEAENLRLRRYQRELAEVGLTGRNCIICAPTGSGKTKVSIKIILEHLKSNPSAKVAFFAKTIPLVMQQYQTIENHLPSNYRVLCITGKSKERLSLHLLLPDYSVVVLTPTILVNHLCGKREHLPDGITSFSLLVFDECHHTQKDEAYNAIMHYYLKEKRRQSFEGSLPQIVGMTATIGIDRATDLETAKKNIMKICGNLDVPHLETVKRNTAELQEIVPRPDEFLEELEEDTSNEVGLKIVAIMKQLEEFAGQYAKELNDNSNVLHCLCRVPFSKKEPEYCQWVGTLRKAVKELKIEDGTRQTFAFRYLDIITDYLQAYHLSLEPIDLAQIGDVIGYLEQSFMSTLPEDCSERTEQENIFHQYFLDLKEIASRQRNRVNPNLEKLATKLRENSISPEQDSRAIIFVRTRVLAEAVVSWLNRSDEEDLMGLNARKFIGLKPSMEQRGLDIAEQKSTIDHFRCGKVKVIVTTTVGEEGIDIPQCNVVIRYNYTRNEVSKVQTRGRSRSFGGKSILLALPSVAKQEIMNCAREKLMNEAIQQLSEKSVAHFQEGINCYQQELFKLWDLKEIREEKKRMAFKDVAFQMVCCGCHKVSLHSTDLKTINDTHRISINRNFLNKIKIEPTKQKEIDDTSFMGIVRCLGETESGKSCNYRIGKLIQHRGCPFVTLGCDKMKFVRESAQHPDPDIKRWKDVPYYIEELTDEQLYEYATAIFQPHEENEATADSMDSQNTSLKCV